MGSENSDLGFTESTWDDDISNLSCADFEDDQNVYDNDNNNDDDNDNDVVDAEEANNTSDILRKMIMGSNHNNNNGSVMYDSSCCSKTSITQDSLKEMTLQLPSRVSPAARIA